VGTTLIDSGVGSGLRGLVSFICSEAARCVPTCPAKDSSVKMQIGPRRKLRLPVMLDVIPTQLQRLDASVSLTWNFRPHAGHTPRRVLISGCTRTSLIAKITFQRGSFQFAYQHGVQFSCDFSPTRRFDDDQGSFSCFPFYSDLCV